MKVHCDEFSDVAILEPVESEEGRVAWLELVDRGKVAEEGEQCFTAGFPWSQYGKTNGKIINGQLIRQWRIS